MIPIYNILIGLIMMGVGLITFIPNLKEILNKEPDPNGSTMQLAGFSFILFLVGLGMIIKELFI